jgi:hypothetical protein
MMTYTAKLAELKIMYLRTHLINLIWLTQTIYHLLPMLLSIKPLEE